MGNRFLRFHFLRHPLVLYTGGVVLASTLFFALLSQVPAQEKLVPCKLEKPKSMPPPMQGEKFEKLNYAVNELNVAHGRCNNGNALQPGKDLYDNIVPPLQERNPKLEHGPDDAALAGKLTPEHPCLDDGITSNGQGWVVLENGVVVTGMRSKDPEKLLRKSVEGTETPGAAGNYVLCFDIDGGNGPNELGKDVFVGNFNQFGEFLGRHGKKQCEGFRLGSPDEPIVNDKGEPLQGPLGKPDARVGHNFP